MKEKILLKLKEACGQNTSISERTLERIAETLAGSITEESQIDAAIELQKPILQEFEGNIKFVAADAVKKVKPADKPQEKRTEERPNPDPNEPEWFRLHREKAELEMQTLKDKLNGYDKEKSAAQITSKVLAKLKEKQIPESYLKGRNLLVETEDGIDQLVTTIEGDYTGFKQEMAEQGVFISVPPASAGGAKNGDIGKQIAEAKNTGASNGVEARKI